MKMNVVMSYHQVAFLVALVLIIISTPGQERPTLRCTFKSFYYRKPYSSKSSSRPPLFTKTGLLCILD